MPFSAGDPKLTDLPNNIFGGKASTEAIDWWPCQREACGPWIFLQVKACHAALSSVVLQARLRTPKFFSFFEGKVPVPQYYDNDQLMYLDF